MLIEANSSQQAEEYADELDAQLKSYSNGLAVLQVSNAESMVIENEYVTDDLPSLSLNYIYEINDIDEIVPNDPSFSTQYYHQLMNTPKAWKITKGSAGIVVAVIDTGIDINHPEFTGRISGKSYNTHTDQIGIDYVQDDYNHGTHVSGIIAATQNNEIGGSGIAPVVTIMAIKANIPKNPNTMELASIIRGIRYAADNGADIINLSLGRKYATGAVPQEQAAISYAVSKGVTVICAAGNESDGHACYPAAYEDCIAVASVNQYGKFDTDYSNFGIEIDISAPGTNIYSSVPKGYTALSGTSMASANVSGTAALIKSANPNFTVTQIKERLYKTVRDVGSLGLDNYYGYGTVDAYAALINVKSAVLSVGDVNDDDSIDAKDVTYLRRYLAGGWENESVIEEVAANCFSDSAIDAKDVTRLRRYLAGGWVNDSTLG